MLFTDAEYPADPYPGARPPTSFVHDDGAGYPLREAPAGWRRDRTPVLAYGSNACPSKITWLRQELGLRGPVIVVRARCHDLAAFWAAGFRARDGQRPATLAAAPGIAEWHAVWFATPDQLSVLDVCEGRGARYDLARLPAGSVTLEDGTTPEQVLAYVGVARERMPLLVSGRPTRVADLPQHEARDLVGEPAPSHGIAVLPPGDA